MGNEVWFPYMVKELVSYCASYCSRVSESLSCRRREQLRPSLLVSPNLTSITQFQSDYVIITYILFDKSYDTITVSNIRCS
jgi:hypothetical protein